MRDGDRVHVGSVDLVVRELDDNVITSVGLELDAAEDRLPVLRAWRRLRGLLARFRPIMGSRRNRP